MSPTYTHRGRISASVPTPAGASNSLGGLLALSSVPPQLVVAAALASYAGQMAAGLSGWPLWALVSATLLPWVPLVGSQLLAMARGEPWLALLALLTLTQVGHLGEHVTQMTQLHVLHLDGAHAHGIFGALDIEWVHFGWNTWVVLAVAALAAGGLRRNPWLWATLALAGWHEAEHVYILSTYLATGIPGAPGLLAAGGALGGGLRLTRPDLHFVYNLLETAPLVAAFVYQLRRSRPVTQRDQQGSPRATRVAEALLARLPFPTHPGQAQPNMRASHRSRVNGVRHRGECDRVQTTTRRRHLRIPSSLGAALGNDRGTRTGTTRRSAVALSPRR